MYAGIYRAKAVSVTAGQTPTLTAYVPQVFGDQPITITDFLGGTPEAGMGWVMFQGGNCEFPVWAGIGIVTTGAPGEGGGADEVWIGPGAPPGDQELWYDVDAPGPPLVSGQAYLHDQVTPSATWVIAHNLGYYPNVRCENTAGDDIEGDITHNGTNQTTVTFSVAIAGKAYCS